MMSVKGYIGIDFGTTNSHFAYSDLTDGAIRATAINLEAAGKNRTTSTCVLWNWPARTAQDVYCYGDDAIEEWLMLDESERAQRRFAAGFKPDLASSDIARLDATAFLNKAYMEMKAKRTPPSIGEKEGMPVVIGVPAKISEAHRMHTIAVAEKAGFGQVECLAEPLGALGYHIAHEQITEDEVEQGVIVVDFGGGTLDVAWLNQDGVREPWGDPLLGGRLFDDLFFQWVTEASRTDLSNFNEGDLLYSWLVKCRELKEKFSAHWRRHQNANSLNFNDFSGRVECGLGQTLGFLRNATLDEFNYRARNYTPSLIARNYFKRVRNQELEILIRSKNIDIFDWIKNSIAKGPELCAGRHYSTIILTGGSSSWPFMPSLVGEIFGVSPEKILCANNPEQTVGEGLAIYNVLRQKHAHASRKISDDLPDLKKEIKIFVSTMARKAASDVADEILQEVMKIAHKHYSSWREKGGSLTNVEIRVRLECQRIPINEISKERLNKLGNDLHLKSHEVVSQWCKLHHFKLKSNHDNNERKNFLVKGIDVTLQMDIGDQIGTQVAAALTVIGGVIAGTILGGGGTALLMSGPFGWIIGAALGGAGIWAGKDKIQKFFCDYNFKDESLTALQAILQPELLRLAMEKAQKSLRDVIENEIVIKVNSFVPVLEQHANAAANIALKKYGILQSLA